jgi:Aerotolerance regulator N-terminal/von Willebrand factor type A domain
MSLFFLHPAYLLGLVAAALPVLIHLLNRRRLKRIRFPAVRFILLSQRRISRTYRLRHWILLALRTLAVLLLVLLLANPIFQIGAGLFAGGGPLSLAIVFDNSLSMKWSRQEEGFKQAKEAARLLISSLNEGDRAALIPTDATEKTEVRLKGEKTLLSKELDAVELSAGTADFSVALKKAYQALRGPAPQKEIWLFTDMALTGWDRFSLAAVGQYDSLIPLKIISVASQEMPLNATIKELTIQGQGIGVGLPLHLAASLINFTDKEIRDLLVQLNVDGQNREQRLVSLPPKRESTVHFQFSVNQPGAHQGYVSLKKEGLAGNPFAYFTLRAQEKLKVLVVDGDPQTSLVQSETFFLARALNPTGESDASAFLPTVIIPEGLSATSLDSYQVLILCNVPAIPDALLPKLKDFLQRGGGLLVFLGDRVQAEDYNLKLFQSSPSLLPGRITDKKNLSEAAAEKIGKINTSHPALQGFNDQLLRESLLSTRVRGYMHSETADRSPLIALANGEPLVLEKKMGSGKVMLVATSADRDWSDLPLKTAYLPLMQSLISYLAGGKRGAFDAGITAGEPKLFSLPPSYVGKSLRIVKPDRKEREIPVIANRDEAAAAFEENNLAGIYRLAATSGIEPAGLTEFYPVNSPFLESRLATIDGRELQAKLNPIRAEVAPIESLSNGGKRTDLSLPLLLLLIITLVSEGWLAQRF